jgi:hypothetical protein
MRVESNPLALKACPEAGSGVHRWILHAGNWCLAEGKSDAEAIEFIRERITRKPSPRDEIETGISKIYNEEREPGEPYVLFRAFRSSAPNAAPR